MIDNKLIEKALSLTGKTMEDMYGDSDKDQYLEKISIEKFCYYLISKDFLNTYEPYFWIKYKESMRYRVGHAFQEAITAYQDWNDKLLVDLLEKLL